MLSIVKTQESDSQVLSKHIKTASGKDIFVYDNVFSFQERRDFYSFVLGSFFKMNGSDSSTNTNVLRDYQIYSNYSDEDVLNMKFFAGKQVQAIGDQHGFKQRNPAQIRVNAGHYGEKNRVHSDGHGLTMLYYANLEWQLDWSGHTMFLSEDLQDCEFLSVYKPGRLVVFDGTIPHCILSPTILSPVHRFTFVIQYGGVEK